MLRNIGAPEIIIIAILLVLVLGWKRLPDAARSLGRSMRIFKSEVSEMKQDGKSSASSDTVRGETVKERHDTPRAADTPRDGDAIREDNSPRTDNTSGNHTGPVS
jgi:sec-independent protein translocase protein TatA